MRNRDELLEELENAAHFLNGARMNPAIPKFQRSVLEDKANELYKIVNEELAEDGNAG